MRARESSTQAHRAPHWEFNGALKLGRMDDRLCDQLRSMSPGLGAAAAPLLRDLHDGGRLLGLQAFRDTILTALKFMAEALRSSGPGSLFRGEQWAAAAAQSMTYWGAVAAGQPDSTVLSMIAKSERGVCELTMVVLEDWVVLDTLGGEFETRRIVYQEDSRAFEKAPPGMPVLPTAAGSVEEGHLGRGAADQPATGVANMRR